MQWLPLLKAHKNKALILYNILIDNYIFILYDLKCKRYHIKRKFNCLKIVRNILVFKIFLNYFVNVYIQKGEK